jgi:hypothetical protein
MNGCKVDGDDPTAHAELEPGIACTSSRVPSPGSGSDTATTFQGDPAAPADDTIASTIVAAMATTTAHRGRANADGTDMNLRLLMPGS